MRLDSWVDFAVEASVSFLNCSTGRVFGPLAHCGVSLFGSVSGLLGGPGPSFFFRLTSVPSTATDACSTHVHAKLVDEPACMPQ